MAKKVEEGVLFEVNGFIVKKNSVYRVKHKVDYDAPSGFVKKGISKVPKTGDSFQAPFTGVNDAIPNSGRWDLGFHETSSFYKFVDNDAVRKEKVKTVLNNVLIPYLTQSGITYTKEDLIRGENEFFNNYRIAIKEDDIYDTSNPIHVFNLYIACLQRKLAPSGRESESTFANAHYSIENLSEKRTRTNVVAKSKLSANSLFAEILKTDIARIRAILMYMGLPVSETTEEDMLIEIFTERIIADISKVDAFLANCENFSTTEGVIELNIYNFLKKAIKSPSSKVTTINGQIYYGDTIIGADIKTSAREIARQKSGDLYAIQKEIILGDEDN